MIKKIVFLLAAGVIIPLLPARETKVISLSPALTDAIVEIGAADLLCGRSSGCDAPGTAQIPVAGNMGYPNVEKILLLRPDYVISDTRHPGGNWKFLSRQGIKVLFLPGESLADYPANIRKLGKILARENSAEKTAKKYEEKIAELRASIPAKRSRVLIVFAVPPVISCGKQSFVNEALILAGAENICGTVERAYFTVSTEYILKSAPEVIITTGVPETLVKKYFQRPEFRMVPAVKEQNFIAVDPDEFCRAGHKLPDAVARLKHQISKKAVSPGAASHSLR